MTKYWDPGYGCGFCTSIQPKPWIRIRIQRMRIRNTANQQPSLWIWILLAMRILANLDNISLVFYTGYLGSHIILGGALSKKLQDLNPNRTNARI